ncbi:MAG: NADH-quinone oxidoreductase subunit C [Verrucomicrobia bacterium]|nr:MAG: NADH-quinone oxidoreductase subunit C [Verrucomicrobiota bacterium]
MNLKEAVIRLEENFSSSILEKKEFRAEMTITLEQSHLYKICQFARDQLGFDMLLDISSVDHYGKDPRFEVVYELYSLESKIALRLKILLSEDQASISTVSTLWATANWHEREVYDMMGITFEGHPDLRRILMWDGYPYYPLRKDFPLEGKPSEMPDVAFSEPAPLQGGPFVSAPSIGNTQVREPRHRSAESSLENISSQKTFIAEP